MIIYISCHVQLADWTTKEWDFVISVKFTSYVPLFVFSLCVNVDSCVQYTLFHIHMKYVQRDYKQLAKMAEFLWLKILFLYDQYLILVAFKR